MKLNCIIEMCIKAKMLCCNWDEKESDFLPKLNEDEKLLVDSLNEDQKKLFYSFRWELVEHMLSIRDQECMDTFLLGFNFGKDLQIAESEKNR